jgi:4-hydroxy-tetrahydrodipicolinate reductase
VRLGIFGASGRMGQQLHACIAEHPTLELFRSVGRGDAGNFGGCDVVIDVALAAATADLMDRLDGAALVTGVTGRDAAQQAAIDAYAQTAPVFIAANFSLGVAVLSRLVKQAAAALTGFDVEVFEAHHRNKADAPSGTALHLAQAAAEGARLPWPAARAPVRDGFTGARSPDQIGISAARGGDVIGEHTVYFFGSAETLELTHRATNRAVFAHGALRVAAWLPAQTDGLHDVDSFLDQSLPDAGSNSVPN